MHYWGIINSENERQAARVAAEKTDPAIVASIVTSLAALADARLDAASLTAYYGAASPVSNDTIEVAYLDGNQAPTLEQQGGWAVDGTEFKVRMDASAKALDWKTLQRNG